MKRLLEYSTISTAAGSILCVLHEQLLLFAWHGSQLQYSMKNRREGFGARDQSPS